MKSEISMSGKEEPAKKSLSLKRWRGKENNAVLANGACSSRSNFTAKVILKQLFVLLLKKIMKTEWLKALYPRTQTNPETGQ